MLLIFFGAVATVLSILVYRYMRREKEYNDPPNTVILCQTSRGPNAPSMSPFCLKLETFLRMTKVHYQSVSNRGFSNKGKIPFIMYNGEKISDSQLCIEFIKKKYNVDPEKNLSSEDKAVTRAFRKMVEEAIFWSLVLYRWSHHFDYSHLSMCFQGSFPPFWVWCFLAKYNMSSQAYAQGLGRHSESEATAMILGDIEAVSHYLGNKQFLMGKEPTEVDCAVFGMFAQFKWQLRGSAYEKAVTETFPNLDVYLLRMKERFWPDWDECITHNGTRKPSK